MFNWLPVAALIDDKIFCVHGGLSPELEQLDQLIKIIRPVDVPASGRFIIKDSYAIFYGLTLARNAQLGVITIEESPISFQKK